ncbi:MAG: type IV pilus twitching motility protein PilT [Elusimicrobiota bacterium]
MLKELIQKILRPGVSDLHLKVNEPPYVRYLGQLTAIPTNPIKEEELNSIVDSLLNNEQKLKLSKEGALDFSATLEGIGRLRINAYKQKQTFALAIRIIPNDLKNFEELHLPKDTLEKLCRSSRGLILISGVTGAGKTTTLNTMINYMNENFSYNIITIEDPMEYTHIRKKSSISQIEIGKDSESFINAMKYMVRQDPDVIALGEIRTIDEYKAAIEGAASGHLVLATIHSSDSLDAIDRIVNAFNPQEQPYMRVQLTNVIKAVISLRLVQEKYGKGVYPATEVLFGTLQIKKLLVTNSSTEVKFMVEKGNAYGMHTFDQDLQTMAEQGLIATNEAINHASNPNDLRLKLQSISSEPDK